jgi:predicted nucleotide-binding protein
MATQKSRKAGSKSEVGLKADDTGRKPRNFPKHTLKESLVLAQKIQDEMGGKPMNRLLLADALSVSPSSSTYRDLLSSANKYGLIEGNEKSDNIGLGEHGGAATQADQIARLRGLRSAALQPPVFGRFFREYSNKKIPSAEMLPKILRTQYEVPAELASDCAKLLTENGNFVDIVRDIGGSPHILLDAELQTSSQAPPSPDIAEIDFASKDESLKVALPAASVPQSAPLTPRAGPKPIFVGHGKNKGPLQQLLQLLTTFRIPYKVVVDEANLGRPIPQKVKDTMEQCGSAILIFTRDEKFYDQDRNELWRPSENVVHELGATSFAYGDRIVIFKEKGLHFPTNFQSIGYIEFEAEAIQARTADLLKELIGFGLVKVTPTE